MTEEPHQEVDTVFGFGRRRTHRDLVRAELGESFDHFVQAATHAAGGVGATVGPRVRAAREQVGPTANRVRDTASHGWGSTIAAFAPLAAAATDGARQAGTAAKRTKAKGLRPMRKKESLMARKRWPMVAGVLAAGAIAGTVVAARRRRAQEWDSYDPAGTMPGMDRDGGAVDTVPVGQPDRDLPRTGSTGTSPAGAAVGPAASGGVKENAGVATGTAGAAKGKAATAEDKLASTTTSITESAKQSAAKTTEKADGLLGGASAPSRNSRR
jgi:hypothetical protein